METLSAKIDKVAEDTAYMRGAWDNTIPRIQRLLDNHETRLLNQEKSTENIRTKVGVAGAVSGGLISLVVAYFSGKLH